MKFMKRANIYQASNYNVTYDPTTTEARSYRWWAFVKVIEGKIIFNSHRYSVSTSKHQSKVRSLMSQLNVHIDMFVDLRSGLQDISTLEELYFKEEVAQCQRFLSDELKREERNEKARIRRLEKTRTKLVKVTMNGESFLYTPEAYNELRLQLSTGDFHTHQNEIVYLKEVDFEQVIDLNMMREQVNEAVSHE